MLVPVSCRRYTLNSERRSVKTETEMVLFGERNAGRLMAAPRLKLSLDEPTVSSLEALQIELARPQSNGCATPTLEIRPVRSRMRPALPRKFLEVQPVELR